MTALAVIFRCALECSVCEVAAVRFLVEPLLISVVVVVEKAINGILVNADTGDALVNFCFGVKITSTGVIASFTCSSPPKSTRILVLISSTCK